MAATLASLLGQASITDHDQVLSACETTLAKSKNDLQALQVKIVALLNLDRFQDAIATVEAGGEDIKQRARLEYAYALYKNGQPAKAAEVARQDTNESDRGLRHVEAQASYRHQDFERAAELYRKLSTQRGSVNNEDMDLRINTGATHAQLEWAGRASADAPQKPSREDMEAFETAYNAACQSIARDELGQAEVLLRRAKELCEASEMDQEEKDAEIVPISIQQLYVLIRQGRLDDAQALAATIDSKDVHAFHDSSTQFVAQTNTAATSTETTNPYLTHRTLYKTPSTILPDKPFTYQSAAIQRNNYTLDLLTHKYDGIIRSTASLAQIPTLDSATISLSAFGAAAHARNQAGKEALKSVLPVLERRPNDIGLLLVCMQLYIHASNPAAAISLLEDFFARLSSSSEASAQDVRYAPGLIGVLVSLYASRGQQSHARSELAKAARYWRQHSNPPISSRALGHLYKSAGAALLESSAPADQQFAAELFTFLHEKDSSDRYASAGLVAALARANPSAIDAEKLSALTPLDRLVSNIDVSALEAAGVAKSTPTIASTSTKRPAPSDFTPATKPKPKKLKKSKTPKDFDPAKKLDPERWLPIKDRSSYRPKGKKAKARQAMFMQGGAVAEDSGAGSGASTPAAQVVEAKSANKKSKKKGKGGKW
ncbi:putative signal recognition particle protein [Aureobasidium sp. EXF-12298]|nr:putative signal recognition particle protein [Aureobasidium sp. EXF-12298]KAI4764370.1 putative signal recognition particle protein [Aureobasidium sp. EXF-12344]KAI4781628.1 putative signal recognition particle protein [Aureobasidium sp. EXF-3400]